MSLFLRESVIPQISEMVWSLLLSEENAPFSRTGGAPTRRSTMLGLLFLSVFTAWKTSTVLWCRSISQTMLMAQKVPLRPPPFLSEERNQMVGLCLALHCAVWRTRSCRSAAKTRGNRCGCRARSGVLHLGQSF